jgi:DNA-binding NarL/FixJ family response regulator
MMSDSQNHKWSPETSSKLRRTEIWLVKIIIGVVFLFAFQDLREDIALHTPNSHLITDFVLAVIAVFLLFVLLFRAKVIQEQFSKMSSALFASKADADQSKHQAEQLKQKTFYAEQAALLATQKVEQSKLLVEQSQKFAEEAHQHAIQSKEQAEKSKLQAEQSLEDKRLILKGLGQMIDVQLEKWKLSAAEKEIAIFLLKGLSHADIAAIRKTSERTVRQQSLRIYSKAGLKGRTDLAAFFLEDILSPLDSQIPDQSGDPAES